MSMLNKGVVLIEEAYYFIVIRINITTHQFWSRPPCYPMSNGAQSDRNVKLSNHLHTQPRLIMHGALPPLLYTYSWPDALKDTEADSLSPKLVAVRQIRITFRGVPQV
jgi:hypothetical protein